MIFSNYLYRNNEYLGRLYLIVLFLIFFGLIALYSISNNPMSIKGNPIEVFPNCELGPRVGFYCSKKT